VVHAERRNKGIKELNEALQREDKGRSDNLTL